MLNWNVDDLSLQQDADEDAVALLPMFMGELQKAVAAFRTASESDDVAEMLRLCHRIRGSAAVYGFKKFADELRQAEVQLKAGTFAPRDVAVELLAVSEGIKRLAEAAL